MCCILCSVLHSPDKGYTDLATLCTQRELEIAKCDSGSAILSLTSPTRSDLRTSQHRRQRGPQTRIFSPQFVPVCRRPRCRKRQKKWHGMRPSILTAHRTETTRRADFAIHLTRRDPQQSPRDDAVHEECRITCDHRHSL